MKFDYESIEAGYYDKSIKNNRLQNFWHTRRYREIIRLIDFSKKPRILDIGCSAGMLIAMLPDRYSEAVGMDISKQQIEYARKNVKKKRTRWVVGGLPDITASGTYDYIILSEVIEHLPKEQTATIFKNIHKKLNKDGSFIITTPNYRSIWPAYEWMWERVSKLKHQDQHINKFNVKSLEKKLIKAGFHPTKTKTILVLTPVLCIISKWLAEKIYPLEKKLFRRSGSIIIIKAEK